MSEEPGDAPAHETASCCSFLVRQRWSTCLHGAVEVGVDEQPQDGGEEAPY